MIFEIRAIGASPEYRDEQPVDNVNVALSRSKLRHELRQLTVGTATMSRRGASLDPRSDHGLRMLRHNPS